MASEAAAKETYYEPKCLVPKDKLLPLAEINDTKHQWVEDDTDIRSNYNEFTKKLFYVNKLDFIKQLINKPYSRTCVFAPTGCMKSSMSIVLEKFFSFFTSDGEKNGLRELFVKAVGEKQYENHAHKYIVFRCSFENLKLEADSSLKTITTHIYQEFYDVAISLGLDISKEENEKLQAKCESYNVLFTFSVWLREKFKKPVVLVFDEVDIPLTWLISQTNDQRVVSRLCNDYLSVLNSVNTNVNIVPIEVGFGIHPIPSVLSQKKWSFITTTQGQYAHFFMFTREDVENIIASYHRNGKLKNKSAPDLLAEIKKCYGGYAFDMFCPASVVRYVEKDGSPLLFKTLRRTFDIITMRNQRIRAFLFDFFFEKDSGGKLTEVSTTKDLRYLNDREVAITQYVFAGLLQPPLRKLPDSKFDEFTEGKHRISMANLENVNMIGYFLEDIIRVSSSTAEAKSRELTTALLDLDFKAFEVMVNKFFKGLEQIELTNERDYHNPLHAYLYVLLDEKSWPSSSEYSKRTGNAVTGQSGRIDVRLKNKDTGRLYIFELKHLGKDSNKTVEGLKAEAFSQVRTRGYISEEDVKKFGKIVVVAVICVRKMVNVFHEEDVSLFIEKKTDIPSSSHSQSQSIDNASTSEAGCDSNISEKPALTSTEAGGDSNITEEPALTATTVTGDSNMSKELQSTVVPSTQMVTRS